MYTLFGQIPPSLCLNDVLQGKDLVTLLQIRSIFVSQSKKDVSKYRWVLRYNHALP